MVTFTTNVPAPYIDQNGCHIPAFADIYAGVIADYQGIFGSDVVVTPDTQDGQYLGILAQAFKDYADAFLSAYNAYSPTTAQGAGLSSIVKTNGIARKVASASTVDIVNVGQAGRTITSPKVRDPAGNIWSMPDFTIPFVGQITVTATCQVIGAIAAPANTAWTIAAPQLGWQSVSNVSDAAIGAPVETDPQLRVRQSQSVALPSQTVLDGIVADIEALPGVVAAVAYENDTDVTDAHGIPAHGTAFVVDGGDAMAIASVIALKKTQGSPTYGTATQTVLVGKAQVPRNVEFFRPVRPVITYNIMVKALPGYTLDVENALKQAIADWTSALPIGTSIDIEDAREPVLNLLFAGGRPYKLLSILAGRDAANPADANVPIAFYEQALGLAANVNIAAS